MKRILLIGGLLVTVVVVASALAWLVTDRGEHKRDAAAAPLLATASTFLPPSGAAVAMDDTTTTSPPTAVRIWRSAGSIQDACAQWRESFRAWIGQGEFGAIQGEVVEGQSCTLEGRKNGYKSRLSVAVYGIEPPQTTLTVTQ